MGAYNVGDKAFILYKVGDTGIMNVDYATVEQIAIEGYYHFKIDNNETRAATYHKAGMYEIVAIFDNFTEAVDTQKTLYQAALATCGRELQNLGHDRDRIADQIKEDKKRFAAILAAYKKLSE